MARRPWAHEKSRHARGYGAAWDRLRLVILKRDGYLCQCSDCKRRGIVKAANEVDHVKPKALGGTDDPDNLAAINADCHKRKTQAERGFTLQPRIGLDGYPIDPRGEGVDEWE